MQKIILFGGPGDERLVSTASAQNVIQTLPDAKIWFLNQSCKVFEVTKNNLLSHKDPFITDFVPDSTSLCTNEYFENAIKKLDNQNVVFFLALHGDVGENGTIQSILEKSMIYFTGSGSQSSKLSFNKTESKQTVSKLGITSPFGQIIQCGNTGSISNLTSILSDLFKKYGALILKPNQSGSSVGLKKIFSLNDIEPISKVLIESNHSDYLVEELITGTELTFGVRNLPDGSLTPLVASEVRMQIGRDFDYQGKYLGHGTSEITPAEIPCEALKKAEKIAMKAHEALGCKGYSRTDIIWNKEKDIFYYLETNTLPGMTKASFIPQQLEYCKIPFEEFLNQQIIIACNRY